MNAAQYILVAGIRLYQWVISPAKTFLVGPLGQCRFTPSCSAYALEAVARHGATLGSWLALKRLCRCHPWGGCGDDPVPPTRGPDPGAQGTVRPTLQRSPEKDPVRVVAQQTGSAAGISGNYVRSMARL